MGFTPQPKQKSTDQQQPKQRQDHFQPVTAFVLEPTHQVSCSLIQRNVLIPLQFYHRLVNRQPQAMGLQSTNEPLKYGDLSYLLNTTILNRVSTDGRFDWTSANGGMSLLALPLRKLAARPMWEEINTVGA